MGVFDLFSGGDDFGFDSFDSDSGGGDLPNPTLGPDLPAAWEPESSALQDEAIGGGGNFFDSLSSGFSDFTSSVAERTDSAEPWWGGIDSTLGGVSKLAGQTKGLISLFGDDKRDAAPGGIPFQRNQPANPNPVLNPVKRFFSIFPQTVNGAGNPGTLFLPTASAPRPTPTIVPLPISTRPAATITTQIGLQDYLVVGGLVIGGFLLYKLLL